MGFDWDPAKDAATNKSRRISFDEAGSVTEDPTAIVEEDTAHSDEETRYQFTGMSKRARILIVTVSFRGDSIRVISARRATKRERHAYSHR